MKTVEEQMLAGLNKLLAYAQTGVQVSNLDRVMIPMTVPDNQKSLFKGLDLTIRTSRTEPRILVYWTYDHPGGGNNMVSIGSVIYNIAESRCEWQSNGQIGTGESFGCIDPVTGEPIAWVVKTQGEFPAL